MLRKIGTIIAGAVIATAVPASVAMASPSDPCPSNAASSCVSGTFTIPAQLTVTLTNSTWTFSGNDGQTYVAPNSNQAITANVQTNDGKGYQLLNVLTSPFMGGAAQIDNSAITPLVFPAGSTTGGTFPANANFGNAGAGGVVVASSNSFSANGGDNYAQQWQFVIPGNQSAGNYAGTIEVLALGN